VTLLLPFPFLEYEDPNEGIAAVQANFERIALAWMDRGFNELPGVLLSYAGATAPVGYLLCDGTAVSRTTYAVLFAVTGTVYGVGDGSTTFNLPDLKGRVPVGVGTATGAAGATAHTLGQKAGEETHALTALESGVNQNGSTATEGSHFHTFTNQTTVSSTTTAGGATAVPTYSPTATTVGGVGATAAHSHTLNTRAADSAHNTMQPYVGLNWIIKT
jgi:microcystin-dependent protein